jgi:peptidoglycan DL-endopeptidase CwlO
VRPRTVRRRIAAALALVIAITSMAVATAAGPALADPGDDGEGGSKSLVEQLDAASKGYLEAKDALVRSKKRQTELAGKVKQLDTELGPRQAALDEIINQAYRTGRIGPMSALLGASTTGSFLDRAEVLQTVAVKENAALSDLKTTRAAQEQAKLAIEAAIRDEQKQVNVMARRKVQAEAALKAANQGQDANEPGDQNAGSGSAKATPAPRDSDGSLPDESATVDDPTTSGRITPRLLHAMEQAQAAGFNHYVACFRHQNSGEHPKGRACDFAADKDGFGGVASGSSKDYGKRLANYFIANSDRLGVLYVIWFRRIWLPSSGWKAYSGGNGDPSSDHTNHVHLSVR